MRNISLAARDLMMYFVELHLIILTPIALAGIF